MMTEADWAYAEFQRTLKDTDGGRTIETLTATRNRMKEAAEKEGRTVADLASRYRP